MWGVGSVGMGMGVDVGMGMDVGVGVGVGGWVNVCGVCHNLTLPSPLLPSALPPFLFLGCSKGSLSISASRFLVEPTA